MNSTYIQNNYSNSGRMPVFMPYNNFPNPPSWNTGCSIFSMPMMPAMMPTYPSFGNFMMPFGGFSMPFGFMGGCCGGGNRFFNMMMSMQLFQSTMNAFSRLAENISSTSRRTHSSNTYDFSSSRTSGTQSPSYTPRTETHSAYYNNYYKNNSRINTNTNLPQLKEIGYNSAKGKTLAQNALSNSVGFSGYCAKYVRMALERSGLSNGLKGDAYDYNNILAQNKNFKEISAVNIDLNSLPAGCILVYDRGQSGYSSQYGHVEITTGSGQAVSDGVTRNIRPGARVYAPV